VLALALGDVLLIVERFYVLAVALGDVLLIVERVCASSGLRRRSFNC
jgi:hypothetical protein